MCIRDSACPAGERPQEWLAHAEEGNYRAAWDALVRDNPIPAVMGRACYHPCETACNRGKLDSAVSIHAVERFLGDLAIREHWRLPDPGKPTGKRVLVIGGGPSGLSAAYQLALAGHAVTLREAAPALGGMMRYGIPRYRLPRDVLDAEVARIVEMGIRVETGASAVSYTHLDVYKRQAPSRAQGRYLRAGAERLPGLRRLPRRARHRLDQPERGCTRPYDASCS